MVSRSQRNAQGGVPDDLVELGRITGAYGIRGWVKIQPHAAGSSALLQARAWWLQRPSAPVLSEPADTSPWQVKVLKSRTQGSTIVGSLDGVLDRTGAESLRGCTVWVSRSAFPDTEEDEYYWVDLIGCTLFGEQDGEPVLLGVVESVTDNGAHAVLRVKRQVVDDKGEVMALLDSKGREMEMLVPFVAAHVHTVDLENRRLESDWPPEF